MNSLNNVINYKNNKCYFIDGPGGSGKSYILNSIITYLNQENISVSRSAGVLRRQVSVQCRKSPRVDRATYTLK